MTDKDNERLENIRSKAAWLSGILGDRPTINGEPPMHDEILWMISKIEELQREQFLCS